MTFRLISRFAGRAIIFSVAPACVWLGLTGFCAPAIVLQYGFDYTNSTVAAKGGAVVDDQSNHPARQLAGNGGTYRGDLPARNRMKNVSGIGSLDLSTGSLTTDKADATAGPGLPTNQDILKAGGLTLEVWATGGGSSGIVLGHAGVYVIQATEQGFEFANGFNEFVETTRATVDRRQWHHLAGVLTNPRMSGIELLGDLNIYVDGELTATFSGARFLDTHVSVTVGNHPSYEMGLDSPFTGMVYEPRVSLGARTPDQFTVVTEATPLRLRITTVGESVLVEWDGGAVLEAAERVGGSYKPVVTSGNSYTIQPEGAGRFFRLRLN